MTLLNASLCFKYGVRATHGDRYPYDAAHVQACEDVIKYGLSLISTQITLGLMFRAETPGDIRDLMPYQ